jgi:hypothetical protein
VDSNALPDGWVVVVGNAARAAEAELARELHRTHILYGLKVVALAKRLDCDDYIFKLGDGRIAEVHLTFAVESTSNWPQTFVFDSRTQWERSASAV